MTEYKTYPYEVALSFAGEDRPYVAQVAKYLSDADVKVFYDEYETATLWGKDLYVHLRDVYANQAKFTVLFASESYVQKVWTNHERQSAQARAISESNEYILPARFDDTEIPGLLSTTGYIDLRKVDALAFSKVILQKLGRKLPSWQVDETGKLPGETEAPGESIRALAGRMQAAARIRNAREQYLNSAEGVQAARDEVKNFNTYVTGEVEALKATDQALNIRTETGRDGIFLVSSGRASFTAFWQIRYTNALTDSALYVREFDGWHHLQGFPSDEKLRQESWFEFDVDDNLKHGWRDQNSPEVFMSSSQLGDKVLSAVIERLYGA